MTQSRPSAESFDPTDLIARGVAVVGVSGIGLVHLLDSIDTYHDTRYVFWLYVAVMAASIAASALLLVRGTPAVWAFVGAIALAPLVGYVLSRTTGLPGSTDDVGNWSDPLGLASLWLEALVLALAGARLRHGLVAAPAGAGLGASSRAPLEQVRRAGVPAR